MVHLWKRLYLIKDFVWGGNSGRNESSKEKHNCCRNMAQPREECMFLVNGNTVSAEVLNKKGKYKINTMPDT